MLTLLKLESMCSLHPQEFIFIGILLLLKPTSLITRILDLLALKKLGRDKQ